MSAPLTTAQPQAVSIGRPKGSLAWRRIERFVPAIVLALMLLLIFIMRPNVMTYGGVNLLLKLAIPLVLAAISQMLIIALGDLDLSTGSFVSFTTCVIAVFLDQQPTVAVSILLASVGAYGLLGAVIHLRQLPSIIVTLGMSFVWLGLALLVLSSPGGRAPEWLIGLPRLVTPWLPFPVWFAVIVTAIVHFGLMRSSLGVVIRGAGGNPRATERAGWSVLAARVGVYMAAGFCAVLSGLMLSALTTSGAPNIAPAYTLLSIAAVILGGGSFVGGVVSPSGAVIGAITLTLVGSVLTFLNVPSVWQIGAHQCALR